jgi:hypothetical protein
MERQVMTNEQIQQRIKYLVEHGGIWDDPLADIRRTARAAVVISGVTLVTLLGALLIFHA